jgi:hypothetical protein
MDDEGEIEKYFEEGMGLVPPASLRLHGGRMRHGLTAQPIKTLTRQL